MPLALETRAELYTAVENLGPAAFFSFLGSHGVTLGEGEVYTQPGDLRASVGAGTTCKQRRNFESLQRALTAGRIRINSVPAPLLFDETADAPKSLEVDNDVLSVVAPTYAAADESSSSTPA